MCDFLELACFLSIIPISIHLCQFYLISKFLAAFVYSFLALFLLFSSSLTHSWTHDNQWYELHLQSQSGFSGMFGGSLRGSLNSLEELSSSAEPHLQLTNGHPAAAYEPSQNHNDDDDDDDSDGGGGGATQIEEQSSHSSSFSRRGESNSNRNSNGAIRGAISPVPEEEQGEDEELEQQEYGPTRRIRSRQQQVQVSPVVSPVRSPVHAQNKRGMNGDADNDVSSGGAAAAAGAAPLSPVPPLNLPPRHSTTRTAATAAAPSAPTSSSSFASSAQVAAPTTSSKAFLSLEPWVGALLLHFTSSLLASTWCYVP